jgi:hypothetical protein
MTPDDPLDEFLDTAQVIPINRGHEKWPSGANKGVAKNSYTHDAMVDLIIANPSISQGMIAAHFKYTASWVCQIIASDSFQARLAERTNELVDPVIRRTIEEQFKGMILRSIEVLQEKLNRPSHMIPDNLALRTFELASRAAGYGARLDQTNVQVNVETHIEDLSGRLVNLLQKKKAEVALIEAQPTETPPK